MSTFLVLIDGPMGSGKTTTSKLLNEMVQGSARVALADVKRLTSGWQENEGVARVSKRVIQSMVREYIKENVSVVVECITKPSDVETYASMAEGAGARFLAYRLTAPKEVLIERIRERTRQMMGVAALPSEKIEELDSLLQRNYQFYLEHESGHMQNLDTSKVSPNELVNRIMEDIQK